VAMPSCRSLVISLVAVTAACDRGVSRATARGAVERKAPRVVISEIMANPQKTPDDRGEWIELRSLETEPIDLRGWIVASDNDRDVSIQRRLLLSPNGFVVLARDGDANANGGVAAYAYGQGLALGNGADWIALKLPDGRTVDSVAWTSTVSGASRALRDLTVPHADVSSAAWTTSTSALSSGDRGTPGAENDAGASGRVAEAPSSSRTLDSTAPRSSPASGAVPNDSRTDPRDSSLVIRLLDVGQGDAILIENGGSRVLIDGGPEPSTLGRLFDRFALNGKTLDAVILTHQHYDHYSGLRELFRSRRGISIRFLFENEDPYVNPTLRDFRDSVSARSQRRELTFRDTDNPCGTGAPTCTLPLRGGARLHLLRPDPRGDGPNNRSVAVKLVAADSTQFSMWLAGDAEQPEIAWFDATNYDRAPGMRSTAMKADHHGSCDGISPRYLDLVRPELVMLSLAATNDYGYVHAQTLDLLQRRRIPWYRTDQNGTITVTVPPRGRYSVAVERGTMNMRGPSDRPAGSCGEQIERRR
jgi:competence protein ComEC